MTIRNASRTYDVRVELAGEFDIDDPLANRAIHYWPDIFDHRRNRVPHGRRWDSTEGQQCREERSSAALPMSA